MKASKALAVLALIATMGAVLLLDACRSGQPPSQSGLAPGTPGYSSPSLALGNPSNATPDPANETNYLIERPQYALSYNARDGRPNWVSWRLTAADLGPEQRGQFAPDPDLPQSFYQVLPGDYTRSGYDRGHNCPSGDRTATREDNDATFLMTNMTPQAAGLNRGPWEELESYTRQLVQDGGEAYIVCGSLGESKRIGQGHIAVPVACWKVVAVLPPGQGDPAARVSPDTRVIAVRMPNISTIRNHDWREFLTTARQIEGEGHVDLFSRVPRAVQDVIETREDAQQ